MTGYGFYRSIGRIVLLALVPILGLTACISLTIHEIALEIHFQHLYGKEWKSHYRELFGSLAQAHVRIGIGIVGIAGIITATVWLIKVLGKRSGAKRKPQSESSPIARITRYKRNALVGIYFGLPGILISVLLAAFRMGIFNDHENEIALAIVMFLASYAAVVTGCYWWLRAKAWNEAIISIAFLPLTVFFVPFVRFIVLDNPGLLVAAMVMMPLILFTIVATLPNRSTSQRRRGRSERR